MTKNRFTGSTLAAAICGAAALALTPAQALAGPADIELFSATGDVPPNILILLDTSGSMDDPACTGCEDKRPIAKREIKALVTSVNDPDGDGVYEDNARFGLMGFRADGAVLQHPIQANATAAMLTAIDNSSRSSVGTPISGAALDVMRYLAGPNEPLGTIPAWGARSGEDGSAWVDPWDLNCRNTYVIYITDGLAHRDEIVLSNYWATVGDADGDNAEVAADVGVENEPFADDITAFALGRDFRAGTSMSERQNVITHVIGFAIDDTYLQNIAADGGGTYYTTSQAGDLASALGNITTSIYDDEATFSTAVVPTSRTLFDASFYNAYFAPDPDEPMWPGHLEAYGLLADGTIVESDGSTPAIDPISGEFNDPPSPYWDAAAELAGDTVRNLYTNKAGARVDFTLANITATDLGINGISAVEIGGYPNSATSDVDTEGELVTALMQFLHGKDGFDDDDDNNYTEMRSVVLGDIFHSSPRIVGRPSRFLRGEPGYDTFYTSNLQRDRIVYVGANDGLLHAFDGGSYNVGDDPGTPTETETYYYGDGDGEELFGFVPGDMLDHVRNVPLNSTHVNYFVDGTPAIADAWLGDGTGTDISKDASEWATVMVMGMREGGDSYLALDVTNPSAGTYPGFLWEFTDSELGQTWSEPVITRVKLRAGSAGDNCGADNGDGNCVERWVAIFGGGYTPNDEGDPNSGTFVDPAVNDVGRAIYMVDLEDGSIVAKVAYDASDVVSKTDSNNNSTSVGLSEMKYAIPSTPAVLDLNADGFADVVYVGDLGGQLWKWDISDVGIGSPVSNWDVGVVFKAPVTALGGGVNHYRNLFFPPSASFSRGSLMLAFGTGERQDLRSLGDAGSDDENRFYVVRDKFPTGPNAFDRVVVEGTNLDDITVAQYDINANNDGYYIVARESEKFVNDFSTFAGFVQAVSYLPETTDPCTAASGESFVYQFQVVGGQGLYGAGLAAYDDARRTSVGAGMASAPRISMSTDPTLDKLFVKTSKGKVIMEDAPPRDDGNAAMIYWKQNF